MQSASTETALIEGNEQNPELTTQTKSKSRINGRIGIWVVMLLLIAGSIYELKQIIEPNFNSPVQIYSQVVTSSNSTCGTWAVTVGSMLGGKDSNSLKGIAIISENDVWEVGSKEKNITSDPLALHWNGTKWEDVAVPSPDEGGNAYLEKIAPLSASYIWAVGASNNDGNDQRAFIINWDGKSWHKFASPNPGTAGDVLSGVTVVAKNNAWAVGYYMDEQLIEHPLIFQWDGNSWFVDPSFHFGIRGRLFDVTALAWNDIWAVGYYYGDKTQPLALMLHWDGKSWNMVHPLVISAGIYPRAISAASTDDVWAVGSDGERGATLHWDGVNWQGVPNASPSAAENNNLNGVVAISKQNAWASGVKWAGKDEAVILHWDGTIWQKVSSPKPLTEQGFYGIASSPQGSVWAVGQAYNNIDGSFYALTAAFTGSQCSAQGTPTSTP